MVATVFYHSEITHVLEGERNPSS